MGTRTLAALAGLAVLLTVYATIFERDPTEWERPVGATFPRLEMADIEEIELIPRGAIHTPREGPADRPVKQPVERAVERPILLRKRAAEEGESSWWIDHPSVAALHPRVESIAWSLKELQEIADVPAGETGQGFDAEGPELTVRFRTRRGEEHRVEIGRDFPDHNFQLVYVRLDGKRLFLTSKNFHKSLSSRLDDLRSRALFPVSKDRVVRLEVSGDPRHAKAVKRVEGTDDWRFEIPQPALGDRELIARALDDLNSWVADSFVRDEPGDLAPFGLDRPRTTISITDRRGRKTALEVGAPVEEGVEKRTPRVYVKWAGQPFVMTAAAKEAESLETAAEELFSRYVLQVGAEGIVQVSATRPGADPSRNFTLRRAGGPVGSPAASQAGARNAQQPAAKPAEPPAWTVELPNGTRWEGDTERIQNLCDRLRYLQIKRYVSLPTEGTVPPPEGIEVLRVDLKLEGTAERSLSLWRKEGDDEELHTAIVAGETAFRFEVLTRIPSQEFGSGGLRFRNRRISDFDPSALLELELTVRGAEGERSYTIIRPGDSWRLDEGGRFRLKEGRSLDELKVRVCLRAFSREDFRLAEWMPAETDLSAREIAGDRFRIRVEFTDFGRERQPRFRRIFIGATAAHGEIGEGYWSRCEAPDFKDQPFLLETPTGKVVLDLAEHLDAITEAAE